MPWNSRPARIFHNLSLAPGFSPVNKTQPETPTASAVSRLGGKPLKRLLPPCPAPTGLKPGANEIRKRECERCGQGGGAIASSSESSRILSGLVPQPKHQHPSSKFQRNTNNQSPHKAHNPIGKGIRLQQICRRMVDWNLLLGVSLELEGWNLELQCSS
jgi:hypothetical protein